MPAKHTVTFRRDGTTVEVDGALAGALQTATDRFLPGVRRAFLDTARERVREAQQWWPVRTGASRDGFLIEERYDDNGVEVIIKNTERYAYLIRYSEYTKREIDGASKSEKQAHVLRKRHGSGAPTDRLTLKSPWAEWVRKPIREAEKRIAQELEKTLAAALSRGGR